MRTTYGPPEVVHLTDVPAPEVGPGDLRVAVHATTVNRTDCGARAGHPFFIRALTGLDLRDPVDRLVAELQLRLHDLRGAAS